MSRSADEKVSITAAGRDSLPEVVLESTSEGIVVADEKGKFVVWNRAATDLVGIGAADIEPGQWSEYYRLYGPESQELLPSEQLPLFRAMRGEVVDEYDLVVHHAMTGRRVWLSCNARPLRDETGLIRGGVVVFRDVTERRRVEQELASYAHTVSHDLKAPLTGVLGFAQALEEEFSRALGPTGLEYVGQIKTAAERMHHLIDDLLLHARIGHDWREMTDVDLNLVVGRAIENLDRAVKRSSAVIEVQKGLPVITGHASGLEQLFQNLIGNAVEYVAPGTRPRIEIGCIDDELSHRLYVRDNGVGIDRKYHQQIFDVFRRLHGGGEYSGTGIGLAIVKKVADLHGGDMWVESEPGRGSTFWLRLPKRSDA